MIRTGKKFSKPKLSRIINGDDVLATPEEKIEKFRLDHLLMEQHPEWNRASLQNFIKRGYVTVDGEITQKSNKQYPAGSKIVLTLPPQQELPPCPPIIYEDEYVRVINKPAGMLSMAKGEYCPEPTLENYGLLVHRLDRDTSGVVILAKDPETQKMLRRQFQNRKAHKIYYALVASRPKLDEAMIDLPIARNLKHPTTFLVDANGKPAQTRYKVIKSDGQKSLLRLQPTTGRTHQLRVHLKYIGCPILGDRVYNPEDKSPRLMLHAQSLEITVPSVSDNLRRTFTCDLPEDFNVLR